MQKNTVRCEAATTWTDLGISAWESALLPPYDPQLCIDDIKYWGTDLNRKFYYIIYIGNFCARMPFLILRELFFVSDSYTY